MGSFNILMNDDVHNQLGCTVRRVSGAVSADSFVPEDPARQDIGVPFNAITDADVLIRLFRTTQLSPRGTFPRI